MTEIKSATITIDFLSLFSDHNSDHDAYPHSPLYGSLSITVEQPHGQTDTRLVSISRDDYLTPSNLAAEVSEFIFRTLGWAYDDRCNDPSEYCLGDCFYNSGVENYTHVGTVAQFRVDISPSSSNFGKII